MKAIAVAIRLLYRVHTALGNGSLLPHLLLWVRGGPQSLSDRHGDSRLVILPPFIVIAVGGVSGAIRRRGRVRVGCGIGLKAGEGQTERGVRGVLVGLRRVILGYSIRGLDGGRLLLRWGRLRLLLRAVLLILWNRDEELCFYPEGQLALGVLGVLLGVIQIVFERRVEVVHGGDIVGHSPGLGITRLAAAGQLDGAIVEDAPLVEVAGLRRASGG